MDTAGLSDRRHPTAWERCRRRREYSIILVIEEAPQRDKDEEEDESEELNASFPGGPTDISLLRSFKTHVAADIWNYNVRFYY